MKRPIPQFEFGFAGAAFNLAGEATADGARVAAEREQAAKDRAESQARQVSIPMAAGCGLCGASGPTCDCASWDYETERDMIPENRSMMKALSTMQGVR